MASWKEFRALGQTVRYCVVDEHPTSECTDFPDSTGFFVWRLACHALCRLLLSRPSICEGKRVLELGAGIALPSACVAKSAAVVVATDGQPPVLAFSQLNITQNMVCTTEQVKLADLPLPVQRDDVFSYPNAMKLTWGNTADEARLRERFPRSFDVCIASDVLWLKVFSTDSIYDQALQLLQTSRSFLAPDGVLIFSYNKRMDGMTVDVKLRLTANCICDW
jgi:predicted nicotinamide N-methyase